jgi:hypothetical protein
MARDSGRPYRAAGACVLGPGPRVSPGANILPPLQGGAIAMQRCFVRSYGTLVNFGGMLSARPCAS